MHWTCHSLRIVNKYSILIIAKQLPYRVNEARAFEKSASEHRHGPLVNIGISKFAMAAPKRYAYHPKMRLNTLYSLTREHGCYLREHTTCVQLKTEKNSSQMEVHNERDLTSESTSDCCSRDS